MEISARSLDLCVEWASRRVSPFQSTLDNTGRGRDDYQQIFRMKAVEASIAFQKTQKSKSPTSGARWVFVSVRNHIQTIRREQHRFPEMVRDELDHEVSGLESLVVKRDLLSRIRAKISNGDWQVLMEYAEAGCNASEAWKSYGRGISESGYRKKLKSARERAREIVKNLEGTVRIFA